MTENVTTASPSGQVSIGKLREVYVRTHPAANLGKAQPQAQDAPGGAIPVEAEELLTALADEAGEEDAAVANGAEGP